MSVRTNTFANFIGRAYVTGIGLVMLPLYLRELGGEAYGLVGFYMLVQSWVQLLNMGLSPTLSRELAYGGGGTGQTSYDVKRLVTTMECIFLVLALLVSLAIWQLSHFITTDWLNIQSLSVREVSQCITLMGLSAGVRLLAGVYASGIQGLEHQVWLNKARGVMATIRYVGAWGLLQWVTRDPTYFFGYILCAIVGETLLLYYGLHRLLPVVREKPLSFSWGPLAKILPFASGVAYSGFIWVMLTQLDKLVLSNVLPLREYGYYALVALIAGSLMTLGGPISTALLPRMTHLLAQGQSDAMMLLYRKASQVVAVLTLPICALVAIFSRALIFAWTGDASAAQWGAPILVWLALGNGLLGLGAFQYYLQYAYGKVKLHVWNSTINVLIQAPLIIFAAYRYGAYGAALTWFILRVISFVIWPTIVHHRFAPGLHKTWLLKDLAPIFAVTGAGAILADHFKSRLVPAGRLEILVVLACLGLAMLLVNVLASWACRPHLFKAVTRLAVARG